MTAMRQSGQLRQSGALGSGTGKIPTLVGIVALVLPLIHAVLLARMGFGFVLDDWYTLRNAHFDGAFAAAGADQLVARPGAWFVYGVVFGLMGDTPFLILLGLAAIRAATTYALWGFMRTFVPDVIAAAIAIVWVLLPITSSLKFWASGANISLALLLAVCGCVALDRPRWAGRGAPLLGSLLLALAALSYEAVVPAAAVAVVAVVWRCSRPGWRDAVRLGAPPLGSLGAASLWVIFNWHPAKTPARHITDFSPVLEAHFGWGIVGFNRMAPVLAASVLLAVTWSVLRIAVPATFGEPGEAEWLVLAGVVVILVSLVPFALYAYEPLGVGDRVNVTSSVGAAMTFVGIGSLVWERQRLALTVAASVLVLGSTSMRWNLMGAYSSAATDAADVVASVPCAVETGSPILAGPRPVIELNVTSFLDADDHLEPAVQLTLDQPTASVEVVLDEAELERRGGPDLNLREPVDC